jgi:hypothetical protein
MVLGAYSDLEAKRPGHLREALTELARQSRPITLRGLDREGVGGLLERLSERVPSEERVASIHDITEGNPLFVQELVHTLRPEALDSPGRITVPVPESIRAVIDKRLAPLSADAVQVLSAAAVVGRAFDLSLLGAACDLPMQQVLGALSEATRGWLSLAEAEQGRDDDARRGLRSLVDDIPRLPRDGLWLPALALASLLAARLEAADDAASLYPLLSPYADRTVAITMPHPVVCLGSASLYLALLAAVASRWDEANSHFQTALRVNDRLGAAAFLARTRSEYARMLIRRDRAADRGRALQLLDKVLAVARTLGLARLVQEISTLREIETGGTVTGVADEASAITGGHVFRREGDFWTVAYGGSVVRVRDSKGLHYLARLLAQPAREFHVVDLEAAESQPAQGARSERLARAGVAELEVRPDLGDAGELLDAKAKAAYRARLAELRAELDEAEQFSDATRAARSRQEIDFLEDELARAVGLGGRDRRAAAHAERARLNVTRAIRAGVANLARVNPSLGRHLTATIRTGRYCSYTPDPRAPIAWQL